MKLFLYSILIFYGEKFFVWEFFPILPDGIFPAGVFPTGKIPMGFFQNGFNCTHAMLLCFGQYYMYIVLHVYKLYTNIILAVPCNLKCDSRGK